MIKIYKDNVNQYNLLLHLDVIKIISFNAIKKFWKGRMVGKINIKNITIKRAIRFVCTFLEHLMDQKFRPKVVEWLS